MQLAHSALTHPTLKASSLEDLKPGAIFSAFMAGGKLVRFLRVSCMTNTGMLKGIVTIGPHWDEPEPFWYDDSVLSGVYRVLDETRVISFHVPVASEDVNDRHLSSGFADGVYVAINGSILLGVRRQRGRTVSAYANVSTGDIDVKFNYAEAAFLNRYVLVATSETGELATVFDNKI